MSKGEKLGDGSVGQTPSTDTILLLPRTTGEPSAVLIVKSKPPISPIDGRQTASTDDGQGRAASVRPTAGPRAEHENSDSPPKLMRGWKQICAFLHLDFRQYRVLKKLNDDYDGPIKTRGPGKPPMVFAQKLLDWFSKMEDWYSELQAGSQQSETLKKAEKLQLKNPSNWGRRGQVFPDSGMHVQQRRSDFGLEPQGD